MFEIVTEDAEAYPLPSFLFLKLQYHLHRVMCSIRAAGALRTIFRDNPRDVDPAISGELSVPGEWAYLLEGAVEEGILDSVAAAKWARAFALRAREEKRWKLEDMERWTSLPTSTDYAASLCYAFADATTVVAGNIVVYAAEPRTDVDHLTLNLMEMSKHCWRY